MIVCDTPILQEWLAPKQEISSHPGVTYPRPKWTKLFAEDFLVSNSIEFARWDSTPVQPIVCETCWDSGCGSYTLGLAFIELVGDYLLWVPPTAADVPWEDVTDYRRSRFRQKTLLMPVNVWNNLRGRFPNLPAADHFPPPRKCDLANLWFDEMPEDVRVDSPEKLTVRLLHEAIASDPSELDESRENVADWLAWMQTEPNTLVPGRFVRVQDFDGSLNSLFFEGPPFPEWKAFVVGPRRGLVFGNQWVFQLD